MNPSRGFGAAAVLAMAVAAGIMASSRGRPTLTPSPRSTVRRHRCFLVMNMVCPLQPGGGVTERNGGLAGSLQGNLVFAKGLAVDDAQHDRGKPVVVLGGITHDGPNGRHVVIVQAATQSVGHQVRG